MGVDIAEDVLEAVRDSLHDAVTLAVADVRQLPFEDESFDVVVCFEVIEHVDAPEMVLDELARVLRADGVVAVSSPNRGVYPSGNPHHIHEFRPDELAQALAKRFEHVRLLRQHDWLASGVLGDEEFGSRAEFRAAMRRTVAGIPGEELFSLAIASHLDLPGTLLPYVVLTQTTDVEWWQEQLDTRQSERDMAIDRVRELEEDARAREHRESALERQAARVEHEREEAKRHASELAKRLLAVETELAEDRQAAATAKSRAADLGDELEKLRAGYAQLEEVVRSMQSTRVWRVGTRYWRARDVVKRMVGLGR